MPKRSRKRKSISEDPNVSAFKVLQHVIDSGEASGKNPMAVALGRLGGLKGGHARAAKLTKEQRSESAKRAATARWKSTRRG
jgi:hypothetical protein